MAWKPQELPARIYSILGTRPFLEGASHIEELVLRARELEYEALALTDHDGLHGSH